MLEPAARSLVDPATPVLARVAPIALGANESISKMLLSAEVIRALNRKIRRERWREQSRTTIS
jgi:hypothetical protein